MTGIVIGLAVLVVVGLPIVVLAIRNTRAQERRETARYEALSEEEKRREAASKKWGNQRRGSSDHTASDFNNELF